MIGIYKITNTENGKVFIGKSNNIMASWKRQTKMAQSEDEMQCQLYQELQEYGIQNFTFSILELCTTNELHTRWQYWVKKYDAYNTGYNCFDEVDSIKTKREARIDIVKKAIRLLEDTALTYKDIGVITGLAPTVVYNINRCVNWKNLHSYKHNIRQEKQQQHLDKINLELEGI